jgi:hypothetical protein
MQKPFVFLCIVLLLSVGFYHLGFGSIAIDKINIKGGYINQAFKGTITFGFNKIEKGELYFHLPPNWYSESDRRENYYSKDKNQENLNIGRKELKKLRQYTHQNIHLPQWIIIHSVLINDQPADFQITDNEAIKPRRYTKNNLLKVTSKDIKSAAKIVIEFTTFINELPEGLKTILWDFAPRTVNFVNNQWDFQDRWQVNYNYYFNITTKISENTNKPVFRNFRENMSVPVLMLDPWAIQNPVYSVSAGDFFADQLPFLQSVLNKPLRFLLSNKWINYPNQPFKFIIWDGALTFSGRTVLLPEKLFRYHSIFNKKMEIAVLKGIINSVLNKSYILDFQNHLWMIPALQSVVIRSYFKKIYKGNTWLFPWMNWLNPNFIQENSIKPWLNNSQSKKTIEASEPGIYTYDSHLYHPWNEKGFHLLPLLHSGKVGIENELEPKVKSLLLEEQSPQIILTPELFLSRLTKDNDKKEMGLKWLSEGASIDYAIEAVKMTPTLSGADIDIEIINSGSISPVLEIELIDENGDKERHWLTDGAGVYQFSCSFEPVQIILDPDYLLLENSILNNSWTFPLKIRPFWDFSPANQWLFTISPIIGGNVFDRNMLGLDFTLSYLNQTTLVLYAWKSDQNEDILFEGGFEQKDFPWESATLSLVRSQLNATIASTLSIRHDFKNINDEAWVNIYYSQEEYENIQSESEFDDPNQWQILEFAIEFPLFEGNFSQWKTYLLASEGQKEDETNLSFQQQSFRQYLTYYFTESDLHLKIYNDYSSGTVPLQKQHPIGGPEGLPGFPRETELLYYQRDIVEVGIQLPPFLTHTKLNFANILWLNRINPTINFHWGVGQREDDQKKDIYRDVELRFSVYGEFINMYEGHVDIAIAQPIGHEKYKDYRFIAFSTWVF